MLSWLGQREKAFWILLVLLTASLWVFMEIADEITDGETFALDETLMMSLRNADNPEEPLGPAWMQQAGQDITALGGNAVLGILSTWVIIFLLLTHKYRLAGIVLLATAGALLASLMLKYGFDRPRPDLVAHSTIVSTSSFPSSHSMLAASVYLTLGAIFAQTQSSRRIKSLILFTSVLLTLLIGISRVYLGVHWPSDVVAGWAVGSAWALMCFYLAHRLGDW